MANHAEDVWTDVSYTFVLPKTDWNTLKSIYQTWVHVEEDPLLKAFVQQNKHMTPDLLLAMVASLQQHVEEQNDTAKLAAKDVRKVRKQQGEAVTDRVLTAMKHSRQARLSDVKKFHRIAWRLVHLMRGKAAKIVKLEREINKTSREQIAEVFVHAFPEDQKVRKGEKS